MAVKSGINEIDKDSITALLDVTDDTTRSDYKNWDNGDSVDCGTIGLIVVLLKQEIRRLKSDDYFNGSKEIDELEKACNNHHRGEY